MKYIYSGNMDVVDRAKSIVVWLKKNKDKYDNISTIDGTRIVEGVGVRILEDGDFGEVVVWGMCVLTDEPAYFVGEGVSVLNDELVWQARKTPASRKECMKLLTGVLKIAYLRF